MKFNTMMSCCAASQAAAQQCAAVVDDTASLGFERGDTGDEQYPAAAYDEALHRAAYAILRLALCSMADFVA